VLYLGTRHARAIQTITIRDCTKSHTGRTTTRDHNIRQEYTRFKEIAAVLDRKQNKGYKRPLPIRGSYPSMLLRYAIIIADEIDKASRSRSETSKAMYALQAEKRMSLTKTPLENDYDKVQTLMKWLRIAPWNDIKVFNDYFVTKKPKKTKAKTLNGVRNAILSTSLRACFFPLAIDDTFNGGRLVEISRHSVGNTKLTLPTTEAAHQKETRPIWGKQKGVGTGSGGPTDSASGPARGPQSTCEGCRSRCGRWGVDTGTVSVFRLHSVYRPGR